MATNDKIIRRSIPLASADFDSIKSSLKEFMKQRPELADYDFDGAMANVLLDQLSLNTHINAFYLNMIGNEAFLKTAVRRDSVVARSEALNYTPSTIRSSSTEVYIQLFPSGTPAYIDIPKYSVFPASGTGISYNFYNLDSVRVVPDINGDYIVDGVEIVEGKFLTHRFVVDANIIEKGIIIPNVNVDSTRMEISIAENTTSTNFINYPPSSNIIDLNSDSEVYFVRELDGFLNVYFGDGFTGKQLVLGSVIRVTYPISSGEASNGAASFTLASSIPGVTSSNVVANSPSFGGAAAESIESIKINAPRYFEAQNRGVTADDYEILVKKQFPNYEDVIAWGGEDNDPPAYGKVFLSIKPASGFYMTQTEKNKVVTFLKTKRVVSITPVIVDPEYIFVKARTTVEYNKDITDKTSGEIEVLVSDRLLTYSDASLSRFDKTMRKSVLSRIIDMSDTSIVSNTLSLTMEKRLFPSIDQKKSISFTFNNPVKENSFISSTFTFNGAAGCYFQSVGNKVSIFRKSGLSTFIVFDNAGTIDYSTGTITTSPIEIDAIPQNELLKDESTGQYYISLSAIPSGDDISAGRKQIVQILSCDATAVPVSKSDI